MLDEEPFAEDERHRLEAKLDEIADEIIELRRLAGEGASSVREEIGGLKRDLQRLNRRQWLRVAIGSMFTMAIRLNFSGAEIAGLFRRFLTFVGDALGVPLLPAG